MSERKFRLYEAFYNKCLWAVFTLFIAGIYSIVDSVRKSDTKFPVNCNNLLIITSSSYFCAGIILLIISLVLAVLSIKQLEKIS